MSLKKRITVIIYSFFLMVFKRKTTVLNCSILLRNDLLPLESQLCIFILLGLFWLTYFCLLPFKILFSRHIYQKHICVICVLHFLCISECANLWKTLSLMFTRLNDTYEFHYYSVVKVNDSLPLYYVWQAKLKCF